MDQEGIQVTALQIIFDILLTFGLEALNIDATEDQDGDQTQQDVTMATSLMDESSRKKSEEEGEEEDEEKGSERKTASSVLTILTSLLDSEVLN